MPIPRSVARLNRVGLNRVVRHIAPYAPGFGLVRHVGRRSGREFSTPVNVFIDDRVVRIALTYGPESDWVKNVLAAGGCTMTHRGRPQSLTHPRLVHDPSRREMPALVNAVLRRIDVEDFLVLDR